MRQGLGVSRAPHCSFTGEQLNGEQRLCVKHSSSPGAYKMPVLTLLARGRWQRATISIKQGGPSGD